MTNRTLETLPDSSTILNEVEQDDDERNEPFSLESQMSMIIYISLIFSTTKAEIVPEITDASSTQSSNKVSGTRSDEVNLEEELQSNQSNNEGANKQCVLGADDDAQHMSTHTTQTKQVSTL